MSTTDPRFPAAEDCVLPHIIRRHAREQPERVFAMFADGETWNFAQLAERVWRRANALAKLGVRRADYVGSLLPTGKAAIETWFATNALGATYAPLNTALRGPLLEHAVNLAGARFLVAHAELVGDLARCRFPALETVIVVGVADDGYNDTPTVAWSALDTSDPACPSGIDEIEPWQDMLLLGTSGTTGPSKAVRVTYLHHYTYSVTLWPAEIDASDRFLLCYPLFHNAGTCAVYKPLRIGASIGVVSLFRTSTFWDDVRSVQATVGIIFPAMVNFLRRQPPTPQDAQTPLRYALTGPILPGHEEFAERFGLRFWTQYGMTEIPTPIRSELGPRDHRPCGTLVDPDHYEARIVDAHDRELPPGEVGELIVRHSCPWTLTQGYKDMPEATADAWRNGWFHTGDAMYRDEHGQYYFVDRKRDAIRRRGENISSAELEDQILSHPEVLEAACIAVPDGAEDVEIKACVCLREDTALSWAELTDYLIERVPHFMVPRYFELYPALPRSASAKVQKHVLREHGITAATLDREAAGIRVGRRVLGEQV
jgi:crotonobetaine/carnitine-CoA ligase